MEIIEIKNINELPPETCFRMYCAEPSPEAAAAADRRKYGSDPKIVYHRTWPTGRSTVYIPVIPARVVIGSQGLIMDRNESHNEAEG
jgi:hypothetical protein